MDQNFTIPLSRIIKEFDLEVIYQPASKENIQIQSVEINRPGLNLTGFYECFDNTRIQVMGRGETAFLTGLNPTLRETRIDHFFQLQFPCLVIARNFDPFPEMIEAAKKYEAIILRTAETTSAFMAGLIAYLNVALAPRITRHGVLIEIYGEGVLILGDSGVGKSETAIELVKRGHRLVADDAVEIRRVSTHSLVGSSPENIRHFLELRGIGIINARRLFGMGSVKVTEKINMIIKLEPWDAQKTYDRMGLENEYTTILGVQIPSHTIPIKPGRNLAIILEVAAMNNRQKKMGYNAAQELMQNLGVTTEQPSGYKNWDLF